MMTHLCHPTNLKSISTEVLDVHADNLRSEHYTGNGHQLGNASTSGVNKQIQLPNQETSHTGDGGTGTQPSEPKTSPLAEMEQSVSNPSAEGSLKVAVWCQ